MPLSPLPFAGIEREKSTKSSCSGNPTLHCSGEHAQGVQGLDPEGGTHSTTLNLTTPTVHKGAQHPMSNPCKLRRDFRHPGEKEEN